MLRLLFAVASAAAVATISWSPASAGSHKQKRWHEEKIERDCTPINGRFGYYGNPWCDTGSYRLEDIEFRERQARLRRWKAAR